jgi:hypothetical protein
MALDRERHHFRFASINGEKVNIGVWGSCREAGGHEKEQDSRMLERGRGSTFTGKCVHVARRLRLTTGAWRFGSSKTVWLGATPSTPRRRGRRRRPCLRGEGKRQRARCGARCRERRIGEGHRSPLQGTTEGSSTLCVGCWQMNRREPRQ